MPAIRPLLQPLAAGLLGASLIGCGPAQERAEQSRAAASDAPSRPAPAPAPPRAAAPTSHWQCGDLRLTTRFESTDLETVTVLFSGRKLSLRAADAREGARFADAAGNEFRSRPGAVRFTRAGQAALACTKSRQASPWADAESRGVAWRAAGNEPGWFAEVASGPAAALDATLDYGKRQVRVARPQALGDGRTGFQGSTADGTAVRLLIERKPCADAMSGEEFEASARLHVGTQHYDGCAAFLRD